MVEFSPLRFENKIFVFDRREKTPPYFLSFIYYLFIFSHRLRRGDLEHRQDVVNHAAHSQAQGNAALLDSTLGIQNAAGIVEAVVGGRHINAVAGDAGRVILLRCGGNLRREGGQQANQGPARRGRSARWHPHPLHR